MITPGPGEPTTQQVVHCCEPLMRDVTLLKEGMSYIFILCVGSRIDISYLGLKMEMYDEDDTIIVEEDVHADFICNSCDTPGARKLSGFATHSHNVHPCVWCRCTQVDINEESGYELGGRHISVNVSYRLIGLHRLQFTQ